MGRECWGVGRVSRESDLNEGRRKALWDLRRVSGIILDNLEEGSQYKLMDQKELRLMGAAAIRAIRLFLQGIDAEQERLRINKTEKARRLERKIVSEDETKLGKD